VHADPLSTVTLLWSARHGQQVVYRGCRSRSARLKKKDRPRIDPFCMQDAETLIGAIHPDWGEAQRNHDEFRFFTGMRPSEAIALVLSGLHRVNGIISVNKARVAGIDRCQTKTGEDRRIVLCPRALAVLKRQLARVPDSRQPTPSSDP